MQTGIILCTIAVVGGTAFRLLRRRLHTLELDDAFFAAAVAIAIVSFSLVFSVADPMYDVIKSTVDTGAMQTSIREVIAKLVKFGVATCCLAWSSIFAAKFSCLAFFNKA